MTRPLGAVNAGLRYVVARKGKELLMAAKNRGTSVEQLSSAAISYRRLLMKALRTASHEDPATLQRLGTGLAALTKALSTIEKLKNEDGALNERIEVEMDNMGNIIPFKKGRR